LKKEKNIKRGIFAFLEEDGKDGVKPRKRSEDMRILAGRDAKRRPFRPKAGDRELGLRLCARSLSRQAFPAGQRIPFGTVQSPLPSPFLTRTDGWLAVLSPGTGSAAAENLPAWLQSSSTQ